jgi:hypothetical protein
MKIAFIFPNKEEKSGGYTVQDTILSLFPQSIPMQKIPIHECQSFITANLARKNDWLIFIFWGKHIDELALKFKGWHLVYYAHSVGYKFKNLHHSVPIVCVSNSTMAYWGRQSKNPLYLLNNPVVWPTQNDGSTTQKTIDVLIINRKMSQYIINLTQSIRKNCHRLSVVSIDHWIDDHADILTLMKAAKVFLYDSQEYWSKRNIREGFGVPPMEALNNRCIVFTSLNDALSDYLDPEVNCFQILNNRALDYKRIVEAAENYDRISQKLCFDIDPKYTAEYFKQKVNTVINTIAAYYSH